MKLEYGKEDLLRLMNSPLNEIRVNIEKALNISVIEEDEDQICTRYVFACVLYANNMFNELLGWLGDFDALKPSSEKILLLILSAGACRKLAMPVEASAYCVSAMREAELVGSDSFSDEIMFNMSSICLDVGDFKKALYFNSRISDAYKGKLSGMGVDCAVCDIYAKGMLSDPKNHAEMLNSFFSDHIDMIEDCQKIRIFQYIAELYEKSGNLRLAADTYKFVLSMKGNVRYLSPSNRDPLIMFKIAKLELEMKNLGSALEYINSAYEAVSNEKTDKLLFERIVLLYAKVLNTLKLPEDAYNILKKSGDDKLMMGATVNRKMKAFVDSFKDKIMEKKRLAENIKFFDDVEDGTKFSEDDSLARVQGLNKFALLNNYLKAVSSTNTESELFDLTYNFLQKIFMFTIFYIACLDEEGEYLNCDIYNARIESLEKHIIPKTSESAAASVMEADRVVVFNTETELMRGVGGYSFLTGRTEMRSAIYVPLSHENKPFGVASVQYEERDFYTDLDVDIFESISEILARAVIHIRKNQQIEHMNAVNTRLAEDFRKKSQKYRDIDLYDELTGLLNVSGLSAKINRLAEPGRLPLEVAVVMLDIDRFKSFNERYGNLMGDEYLKELAGQMKALFKEDSDVIVRLGGEEFLILLPGAASAVVLEKLEKLRIGISEYGESFGLIEETSISAGAVSGDVEFLDEISELIAEAEKLLRNAKNSGRNKICSTRCKG